MKLIHTTIAFALATSLTVPAFANSDRDTLANTLKQQQQQQQGQIATGGAGGAGGSSSNSNSNNVNVSNTFKNTPSVFVSAGQATAWCQGHFAAGASVEGFGAGIGFNYTVQWCKKLLLAEILRKNYGLRAASLQLLINEVPEIRRALKGYNVTAAPVKKTKARVKHRKPRKAKCRC